MCLLCNSFILNDNGPLTGLPKVKNRRLLKRMRCLLRPNYKLPYKVAYVGKTIARENRLKVLNGPAHIASSSVQLRMMVTASRIPQACSSASEGGSERLVGVAVADGFTVMLYLKSRLLTIYQRRKGRHNVGLAMPLPGGFSGCCR